MAYLDLGSFSLIESYKGGAADGNLFGANFLFNRDGTSTPGEIDPNYVSFIREAAVSTLRYPGGTLAETRLDLSNPDSITQNYMEPDYKSEDPTVSLSSFMDLCKSVDASATIVLPTYRFLSDMPDAGAHRTIDPAEESNLRSYIRFALSTADEAGVSVSAFEVGNEWHVDNTEAFGFRMSPVEYGRVANYMSVILQEEIDLHRQSSGDSQQAEPSIVVQVGPGGGAEWYTPSGFPAPDGYAGKVVSATELIIKQFTDPDARAAVDGVVMHRYLHGTDQITGEWVYSPFSTWDKLTANISGFQPVDQYVTEWNVSSRNTNETGLAQFDTMVELFREMMLVGVDHANVWAIQQNNRTRLIANTGSDNDPFGGLTFGGLAFDICAAQLQGLRTIRAPEEMEGMSISAFGSAERTAIFLTNRSSEDRVDTVNLAKISSGGHHATIYHISEGEGGLPMVIVETLRIDGSTPKKLLESGALETFVIVIARTGSGAMIEGYDLNDNLSGSRHSDTIQGGDGNDSCDGSDGNDLISGEAGSDCLLGMNGNDILNGQEGSDYVDGGAGNDTIIHSQGLDTIFGGLGTDILSFEEWASGVIIDLFSLDGLISILGGSVFSGVEGYAGSNYCDVFLGGRLGDFLVGRDGNDSFMGGSGNDNLYGDGDEDSISGGDGDDSIFGGSGDDCVNGDGQRDLIIAGAGCDTAFGGSGDDTVTGGADADDLQGGEGHDLFVVAAFADLPAGEVILGDAGTDELRFTGTIAGTLVLGAGVDVDRVVIGTGTASVAVLTGTTAIHVDASALTQGVALIGNAGMNRLTGSAFGDSLNGGSGNDFLFGGAGDDTLVGGAGNDTLNGGTGTDTASYAAATSGVTVNLALATAQATGGAGTDVLALVEDLVGSGFGDRLTGSTAANRVMGGVGNDTLTGGAGADELQGGEGNDLFVVATFADHAAGEVIIGDAGRDVLRYTGTTAGTLVLAAGVDVDRVVIGTGTAAAAVLTGTAAINVDASALAQGVTLIGNAGANRLTGSASGDSLNGGSGNDTLDGGAGDDTLTGGAGVDTFVLNSTLCAGNVDLIGDFNVVSDTIHLDDAVFAGLAAGVLGNAAFIANLTGMAADALDRIVYESTTGNLYFDADGSESGERVHFATVAAGLSLTSADFVVF